MTDGEKQWQDDRLRIRLGGEELVVSNRYETLSIANDLLIALFFLAGSIMFYVPSLHTVATTMFVLGSLDFLLRPLIRIARRVHLQRIGAREGAGPDDY